MISNEPFTLESDPLPPDPPPAPAPAPATKPKGKKGPVPRRPQTLDESIAAVCLKRCGFTPASWDKRFVRELLIGDTATITEKESAQLWRLFIRYRRQIDHPAKQRLLALAETLAAPDFRKRNAQ